jgi:hypothetical protein
MKTGDLITELKKYPDDARVSTYDNYLVVRDSNGKEIEWIDIARD